MLTDPIADLLTRIRNALMVKKSNCTVGSSNQKIKILTVLKEQGYINNYSVIKLNDGFNHIDIKLKYFNDESVIRHLSVVSKPGLKLYVKALNIPIVHQGLGIVIISTSEGIMTGAEARKRKIGGKLLAYIW